MTVQQFKSIDMGPARLALVDSINAIVDEYRAQGYTLTLHGLFYQRVARGLIPNTLRSYKRLGDVLNDGRLAGLVSWDAVEDATRYLRSYATMRTPANAVKETAKGYRRNGQEADVFEIEKLVQWALLDIPADPSTVIEIGAHGELYRHDAGCPVTNEVVAAVAQWIADGKPLLVYWYQAGRKQTFQQIFGKEVDFVRSEPR